jgi:hypothetical protein
MTDTLAMPGVWMATTDPTVEQVGQKCEADEVTARSAQKWNCAARKTIPRSKTKTRARSVQTGMCLVRRSLGRIGCAVKETRRFHWFLIATNLPHRPSKGAKLKCRLCTQGIPFSDDRRRSAPWRYWLAPRCCISRQAAASFTSTRKGPKPPAMFARRCTCRRWRRRRSISSAHLRLLPGIPRSRCTRPRAIPLPCIAPGVPLPPRSSICNSNRCS